MTERTSPKRNMPYDIRERTFAFAVRVVKLVRALPNDNATAILGRQVLRSATSIGANIEEAEGTTTAKDRTYKRTIARKEALETRYWLRLLRASILDNAELQQLEQEISELIRIISALIIKNVPPPTR